MWHSAWIWAFPGQLGKRGRHPEKMQMKCLLGTYYLAFFPGGSFLSQGLLWFCFLIPQLVKPLAWTCLLVNCKCTEALMLWLFLEHWRTYLIPPWPAAVPCFQCLVCRLTSKCFLYWLEWKCRGTTVRSKLSAFSLSLFSGKVGTDRLVLESCWKPSWGWDLGGWL